MNDDDQECVIAAFQEVIENIVASHSVLQAQVEVIQSTLSEALEQLGLKPTTQASWDQMFWQGTIDQCNRQLAHIADDQPTMASKMKILVDEMISRGGES